MGFKSFVRGLNESVKEITLNKILDKISRRGGISDSEKRFLDNYDDFEGRDWKMLSKENLVKILNSLISSGKKIICNLHDRNGKLGLPIIGVESDFGDEEFYIIMKREKMKLSDRFLYNLIWNFDGDYYSLEEDSEYFEKIPVK